jgi:prepilin-type N-terminal cleavage/methylation domain-containing protein
MRSRASGFTLMELMITVAILGILAAIGVETYQTMVLKSQEGSTRGGLGALRSALSIYYGNLEGAYPTDDLSSLASDGRYLAMMPLAQMPPHHLFSRSVTSEISPTDQGRWSYNNSPGSLSWGTVRVGCLHQDTRGETWSVY